VSICRDLWRLSFLGRLDLASLLISFFGCLFLDIQYGIVIGIGASLAITLYQMARPPYVVSETLSDLPFSSAEKSSSFVRVPDSMLILRIESSMVFFNTAHLTNLIARVELNHFAMVPVRRDDALEDDSASVPLSTVDDSSDQTLSCPSSALLASPDSFYDPESELGVMPDGSPETSRTGRDVAAGSVQRDSSLLSDAFGLPSTRLRPCRMRVLLLDFSSVNVIDTSAVRSLYQVCREYAQRAKPVSVHFACVKPHIATLMQQVSSTTTDHHNGCLNG
jgi:MFS superfamily sulfate permease-like transporter